MTIQSSLVAEISEYIEKLPTERQLKLLNQLKREKKKTAKPVTADILKLSAQIKKSAFKKVKSRYS
jgi:hypothetical protein